MAESCESCRFYGTHGGTIAGKSGSCRRYPPAEASIGMSALRPVVKPTDWCGEYQLAPAVEVEAPAEPAESAFA